MRFLMWQSVAAANVLARLRAHCASLLALADAENLSLEVAAMNDRVAATLFSMRSALAQMTGLKSASRSPTAGV
jgi:hypothetical protein